MSNLNPIHYSNAYTHLSSWTSLEQEPNQNETRSEESTSWTRERSIKKNQHTGKLKITLLSSTMGDVLQLFRISSLESVSLDLPLLNNVIFIESTFNEKQMQKKQKGNSIN